MSKYNNLKHGYFYMLKLIGLIWRSKEKCLDP